MNARRLTLAAVALGIFASSGAVLRAQSITFSFGDRDRQSMREWYRDHPNAPEFRRDWDRRYDDRLQVGLVLGPDLQVYARPAPPDLYGRLAPLPRGWQYMIVGDNLVVVDRHWRIRDVNRFERWDYGYGRGRRGHWNDRLDARIEVGEVLAPSLRVMTRPVSPEVLYRLPRKPRYLRYVTIGDRVLLVDNAWIVRDVRPL